MVYKLIVTEHADELLDDIVCYLIYQQVKSVKSQL